MSLLNPGLDRPQAQRQAASLRTTLAWYARHGWSLLETAGRRRAARELARAAARLRQEGHPAAAELQKAADEAARG